MKRCSLFIMFLSLAIATGLNAQNRKLKRANKEYQQLDFIKAINLYEGIASKGYTSPELYKKLGNSYYYIAEPEKAASWYKQLLEENVPLEADYYFRYAQSLKTTSQFHKANAVLDQLVKLYPTDIRGQLYNKNPNYLDKIFKDSTKYKVVSAPFNSAYSEYAPVINNDKIIFTSARDTGFLAKNIQSWDYKAFAELYTTQINTGNAKKLSKGIHSRYNESTAIFTKSGEKVYFTRNNTEKNKLLKGKDQINRLQIYQADILKNGEWTNVKKLPFNSNDYSVAHPTLNAEENKMFFVSDQPGGKGMSDIYVVEIHKDGSFSNPINLGDQINTEARESFPYISPNGKLYFASEGQPGLGGFDIFSAEINDQLQIKNITNLGASINTPQDDFSITIYPDEEKGYFASNRKGGMGSDDIYMFTKNCIGVIAGNITNNQGVSLENTSIIISGKGQMHEVITSKQGDYIFNKNVDCGEQFSLHIEKEGYLPIDVVIETGTDKDYNFTLETDDLNERLELNDIYFGFDKSVITEHAKEDLNKIVAFLKENKNYHLEVAAYTDRIGDENYNLKLSQRRAKSTANYIISQGIDANRIISQGKGEAQLATKCFSEGPCDKSSHKENRRSEFKLIKSN